MLTPAGDGGSKLDAVLRAARRFLDRFALGEDAGRVALVAFNYRAWVVQTLTDDPARLRAGLGQLPGLVAIGTRLDQGLAEGGRALGGSVPGRWRAMVFLTDGVPVNVPTPVGGGSQEDTVLAVAAGIRAGGVVMHTVGYGRPDAPILGDRIQPELLKAIAGNPANYHQTDNGAELAGVFLRIAKDLGCAREPGWP
jgi:hypothetical protein